MSIGPYLQQGPYWAFVQLAGGSVHQPSRQCTNFKKLKTAVHGRWHAVAVTSLD